MLIEMNSGLSSTVDIDLTTKHLEIFFQSQEFGTEFDCWEIRGATGDQGNDLDMR